MGLHLREGSLVGPFPPPLANENPFPVWGRRRIFLLFSKVVALGLLTAASMAGLKMVLPPPRYSPILLTKGVLVHSFKLRVLLGIFGNPDCSLSNQMAGKRPQHRNGVQWRRNGGRSPEFHTDGREGEVGRLLQVPSG